MYEGTKVTNEKTGDSVTVEKTFHRSFHKQKEQAIKILRGRQWARENGYSLTSKLIVDCNLPDDNLFPHELLEFRKSISFPNQ